MRLRTHCRVECKYKTHSNCVYVCKKSSTLCKGGSNSCESTMQKLQGVVDVIHAQVVANVSISVDGKYSC